MSKELSQQEIAELITKIEYGSLSDLKKIIDELAIPSHDWQYIERALATKVEYCARMSAYISDYVGTYGCGSQGHEKAVKAQNKLATKIRRALGFSYPKQDINF